MAACFDGEVTFHDCDDAMMFLGGGSDDAGFVQVIQGRLSDPERFRTFMSQPMDALQRGAAGDPRRHVAIDADGTFTETVAFRSEAEARESEENEMPDDLRAGFEDELAQVQDMTYLDLHHPWFTRARGTGLRTRAETLTRAFGGGGAETVRLPAASPPIPRPRRSAR